jgi:hypothetical protein
MKMNICSDLFSIPDELYSLMIPINLGITFNKLAFDGQPSEQIKEKVVNRLK